MSFEMSHWHSLTLRPDMQRHVRHPDAQTDCCTESERPLVKVSLRGPPSKRPDKNVCGGIEERLQESEDKDDGTIMLRNPQYPVSGMLRGVVIMKTVNGVLPVMKTKAIGALV